MNLLDIFKTSSANLWANKGRTFLTVIAIFVGAFTISITSAVNTGVNNYIDNQLSIFGGSNSVIVAKTPKTQQNSEVVEYKEGETHTTSETANLANAPQTLSNEDLNKIKKLNNVEKAEAAKAISVEYIQAGDGKKLVSNINGTRSISNLDIKAGETIVGRSDNSVAVPASFVEPLGFKNDSDALGKDLKLAVRNQASGQIEIVNAKIKAILNKNLIQSNYVLVPDALENEIFKAQTENLPESLLPKPFAVVAHLKDDSKKAIEDLKSEAEKQGFAVRTIEDQISTIKNVINAITGVLTAFGAIALIAASFGIINTLYMSVRERTREIGLMKAMGMPNFKVFLLFSVEAIIIGVLGSVLGILAAQGAGSVINHFASTSFLSGLEGFTLTQFTLLNNLTIVLIVGFIAFLAGALPSIKASKKDPIEALRYE